jgi:outer membrane lipoprotein-sorting protein
MHKNFIKMKKSFSTLLAVLFIVLAGQASAQNLDDVLAKHFKTVGQEKLVEKQTYSVKATIQQMGMELPMVMKMKRPNKFRMEMEMQGQKMIRAYDGEKGWMIAPWISSEPQDLSGPELDQAMDQANIDGELYNYKEKGTTATLLGKVNVDGSPMFNIKLTDKNGNVKNYFIDAESYLVRKVKAKISSQGQEVEIEQNLSDYKNMDGILMPMKMESKMPMGTANIIFENITFGENFDDSIFTRP